MMSTRFLKTAVYSSVLALATVSGAALAGEHSQASEDTQAAVGTGSNAGERSVGVEQAEPNVNIEQAEPNIRVMPPKEEARVQGSDNVNVTVLPPEGQAAGDEQQTAQADDAQDPVQQGSEQQDPQQTESQGSQDQSMPSGQTGQG